MRTKHIFTICCLAMLVSCSDFLEENQTTSLQSSCYETEEMLESNILGIVQSFSGTWSFSGEPAEFYSIASGLTHWGGATRLGKAKWDSTLEFTQYSTTEVNNYFFREIFCGIEMANVLLAALPSSPVDAAYKKEIEAEARFYRAVLYFAAVRVWGDLPLRLGTVNVDNSTSCPRTHYCRIYEAIVSDLEYAEQNMRSPERVKLLSDGVPRPCKYAATAYLSSVYTTIGSLLSHPDDNFWDPSKEGRAPDFSQLGITTASDAYSKALATAERIIRESETFDAGCKYELVSSFADLFNYDPDAPMCMTDLGTVYNAWTNPEQIFVLSYSSSATASSYMASRTLPQNPGGTQQTGATNGNNGRWRPNRWVFWKWCETYPGRDTTMAFKSQNVTLHLTSSDPRIDATLYYGERPNAKTGGMNTLYPNRLVNSVASNDDCIPALPYFKKYWSTTYNNNQGEAGFYQMRYAEVYLNAAEAAAALGKDSKAYKYVEVIHARARRSVPDGQPESDQPKWVEGQFSTKDALLTAIFWERVYELYGECHEWYDTHRNGAKWLVENIAKPKNSFLDRYEQSAIIDQSANCCLYPSYFRYSTDETKARKGLLAAFPYNEMLYNQAITENDQNDFYIK